MAFVYKRLYNFSYKSIILRTLAYTILSFVIVIIVSFLAAIIYGIYMGYTGQIPVNNI